MQSIAAELEEKTKKYWTLSRQWNNLGGNIATFEALDTCTDIMTNTNQVRPIVRRMKSFRSELIQGESVLHETPATIFKFAKVQHV